MKDFCIACMAYAVIVICIIVCTLSTRIYRQNMLIDELTAKVTCLEQQYDVIEQDVNRAELQYQTITNKVLGEW